MTKIENYVNLIKMIAADDSHGYDQLYRWGEHGDYDCSSLVITVLENSGIPVKSKGATYTGNMYGVMLDCEFEDVTSSVNLTNGSGAQNGDIFLNHAKHVGVYDNGLIWQASINEKGTATGGTPGDQTGYEIGYKPYYNYPWDCVIRYKNDYGIVTLNYSRNDTGVDVTAIVRTPGEPRFRWKLFDIEKNIWSTYVDWTSDTRLHVDKEYANHLIYCELYDDNPVSATLLDTYCIGSTLGRDVITGTYASTQADGTVLIGMSTKPGYESRMLCYSVDEKSWFDEYVGTWARFTPNRGREYIVQFEARHDGKEYDRKAIGFTLW